MYKVLIYTNYKRERRMSQLSRPYKVEWKFNGQRQIFILIESAIYPGSHLRCVSPFRFHIFEKLRFNEKSHEWMFERCGFKNSCFCLCNMVDNWHLHLLPSLWIRPLILAAICGLLLTSSNMVMVYRSISLYFSSEYAEYVNRYYRISPETILMFNFQFR